MDVRIRDVRIRDVRIRDVRIREIGYVFRRAWEITWRHKALWVFGFLAQLGAVAGHVVAGSSSRWDQLLRGSLPQVRRAIADFTHGPYVAVAVAAMALLCIAIGLALALLSARGRAAMVDQVQAAESRGTVALQAGWLAGKRQLWPVFFIRLLLGLPVVGAVLGGMLPFIGTSFLTARQDRPEIVIPGVLAATLASLTCLLPGLCLAVVIAIPLSVLRRLAVRACVLEGLSVRESIVRAWTLLQEYLGSLALLWMILLGIGIGLMIVLGLPLVLVMASLVMLTTLTVFISPLLFVALTAVTGLAVWLAGAAVNGVVETFFSACWTLAYRELAEMGLTGEEPELIG
jgi:hypothetical protein